MIEVEIHTGRLNVAISQHSIREQGMLILLL